MNTTATIKQVIQTLIEANRPEAILYIGLGSPDVLEEVCRCTADNPATVITLIDPDLHTECSHTEALQHVKTQGLDTHIEYMSTSADEVLPDLYFQELTFDMAILNPCRDYNETFVSFYYIDKMLQQNGLLLIPNTDSDIMAKLSRHLVKAAGYQIKKTPSSEQEANPLEQLLRRQYARIPAFIRQKIELVIREDILITDQELGLDGSFVVFEKCEQDEPLDQQVDQWVAALS